LKGGGTDENAMEAALSLGSNLGNRMENLRRARAGIGKVPGVRLLASSSVYETDPVDVAAEHRDRKFLNAAVLVETELTPEALAGRLQALETALGRRRCADRNAPRVVDIDLLYVGAERRERPELRLPHPRWTERRFVVQPLADVAPDRVLPGETRTVREILAGLPAVPAVRLHSRDWKGN
jgi:2-amino-4-hydroxy-6-hydroxymethyldihydropteridine diphosphokinase